MRSHNFYNYTFNVLISSTILKVKQNNQLPLSDILNSLFLFSLNISLSHMINFRLKMTASRNSKNMKVASYFKQLEIFQKEHAFHPSDIYTKSLAFFMRLSEKGEVIGDILSTRITFDYSLVLLLQVYEPCDIRG